MIQEHTKLVYESNTFKVGQTNILTDQLQSGMKNIFLISTTIELLNAIEAQHYFKTNNNILILFFSDKMNKNEINELFHFTQLFPYSKLIVHKYDHTTNIKSIINVIPKLKYNYFFTGNVMLLEEKWLTQIKYNILYILVDNPSNVIYTNKILHKDSIGIKKLLKLSYNIRQQDKLYFFKALMHNRTIRKNIKTTNFFTGFDLNTNHKRIDHNYEYVLDLAANHPVFKNYVVFHHEEEHKGYIELINLKQKNSIENERYITSKGVKLYIYPSALEDALYEESITGFLKSHEGSYTFNEYDSDVEKIQKLQMALIYFDPNEFETIINSMMTIFISRVSSFSVENIEFEFKRYIWILRAIHQLMRFLFYATNYFILHKGYFIEMNSFYKLFDHMTLYYSKIQNQVSDKEKDQILTEFVWIFSHYAKRASRFNDVENINSYLYKNKDIFEDKLLYVLLYSTSYCYYKEGCVYEKLLNNIYNEYINKELYKEDIIILLDTLKIANFSSKNIDDLCLYFFSDITEIRLSIKISILQNILESSTYYQLAMDELWSIYKNTTFSHKYRRNAGFILIEAIRKTGNSKGAKILYLEMFSLLPCENRSDAIRYIDQLEPLALLYSHQHIFKYLYINFIAIPFLNRMNVDITRNFLIYQFTLSKLDKLKDLHVIYQKRFRPKVLELIENKNYTRIIYINPSDEFNNGIFPLHIYDNLLDNKVLIMSIERGNINFFNDYIDPNLPTLGNQNNTIVGKVKHWNESFNQWIEDFENKEVICSNTNIYQGVFEQISRWQKRFSVDFDSLTTKVLWSFFKRIIDRNLYIIDYCIKHNNNTPISFLSITSHYPPWSIVRDKSLQPDNRVLSFIHVCPTYENYLHNMKNDTLSTITALNLTKYRNSRIAGFGASELFLEYTKREYGNTVLPNKTKAELAQNQTGEYMNQIEQARKDGKTIICLLGKIVYDLAVPNMSGTFSDMKTWVQETIEFVSQRDDMLVLVKPHPHEVNYSISQYPNESFLDFVEVDSPNIYLMGHHEAGLDKLIGQIDAFILWNGTSVIELANEKENIIVCDDWAKKDYPIDLYQPVNKEEYYNAILNAKEWDKNSELATRRQRLAYLYVEYMKNGDFFARNPGVVRSSTNIDWNNTYINLNKIFAEFNNPTQDWDKLIDGFIGG